MAFYLSAHRRNPEHTIRVHLLLLSLTKVINASHTNRDISTISENNERALKSIHYTLPCYSASRRALESQRTKGTAEEEISVIVVYSLITVPTALLCQSIAPEGVSLFSI